MKYLIVVASAAILLGGCQTTDAGNRQAMFGGKPVVASWYSSGHTTASGQRFNPNGNTVAHRTLPFGTKLRLTNPQNGRSVNVVVNDRGPFIRGTEIDVARGAANQLGFIRQGKTRLVVERVL